MMKMMRLRNLLCRPTTRRNSWNLLSCLILLVVWTTVVWAESGVARCDSTIPPPPPPRRPTTVTKGASSLKDERLNSNKAKIPPPPPPKELPTREEESQNSIQLSKGPPPPPPRRKPPTSTDSSQSVLPTGSKQEKGIPPPPLKSKPPPPEIHTSQPPREQLKLEKDDSTVVTPLALDLENALQEDSKPDVINQSKLEGEDGQSEPAAISLADKNKQNAATGESAGKVRSASYSSVTEEAGESKSQVSLDQPDVRSVRKNVEDDPSTSEQLSARHTGSSGQWSLNRFQNSPSEGRESQSSTPGYSSNAFRRPPDRTTTPLQQNPGVPQALGDPRSIQNYRSQQGNPPQSQGSVYRSPPGYANSQQGPSKQYRPPRPQYRPQPRLSGSIVSSSWKAIWGRVEQGLDSLVQVEDVVADRAQQLVSRVASQSQLRPPTPTNDNSKGASKERVSKTTSPTKTPLTPYGQKYEIAKKQQQEASQQGTAEPSRKVNWNDLTTGKMIRANGGASSPNGQHPVPPSNYGATSMLDAINQAPATRSTSTNLQHSEISEGPNTQSSAQTSQYTVNPYLQSSNLNSPPRQSQATADPHSRASRIPWDSSSTTSPSGYASSATRQQPPRRPQMTPGADSFEKTSFASKLLNFAPKIPKLPNPVKIFRFGKKNSYEYPSLSAWRDDDDEESKGGGGLFGLFRRKAKDESLPQPSTRSTFQSGDNVARPLKSLMSRCAHGKTNSLLSTSDETRCRTIGRYQAFFDGLCVLFVLIAAQQVDGLSGVTLPASLTDLTSTTLPMIGSLFQNAFNSWAPIFAGYAYLAVYVKRGLLNSHVQRLANTIGSKVEDESQYAQLYLRLAAAIRMDPSLPSTLRQAAAAQVKSLVSTARLNSFVSMMLGCLVLMTVSFIGPCFAAIGNSLTQLVLLEEWRSWPIAWHTLWNNMQHIFGSLGMTLESHLARGLTSFLENPIQFAFHLSIVASSLLITLVPSIEKRKKVKPDKDDDDDDAVLSPGDSAQQFAKLGASSATRLTMLSENGSIESALERWRSARGVPSDDSSSGAMILAVRRVAYTLIVAMIAALPIVVSYLIGMTPKIRMAHIGLQWDSIWDVSVVLVGVFMVASHAIHDVVAFSQRRGTVKSFLTLLSTTLEEIKETNRRQADIQFMASVSPTAGLVVKDLWAAHTTKRAWAVRGANLQCKNGEILAILGDDGAGKTRMLTTIAESLISPPRRSLTSNKIRGFIGIGGVDGSKWDKERLKRRLGVLLCDVRTVADTANLYSGYSMEEMLEPVDGLRSFDTDHKLSSSEKASILLALKITGLYSSLIPKLPSKLSTVLTANEEDLRPSALRPRSQVLSPAEWSKLILAKVLAQTIFDNDNAAASTDKIESCMVGSVLLLDDPTVLLSEVEEAKILKELRQSGAATILASNKWATGRFADHIAVVRDGSIVESGTHNELISRGPQSSLYAAKWHAMTMQ